MAHTVIPPVWTQRQEDCHEFEASLSYIEQEDPVSEGEERRKKLETIKFWNVSCLKNKGIRTVRNLGSPGKFCKATCQFWKILQKRRLRTEVVEGWEDGSVCEVVVCKHEDLSLNPATT